MELVYRRLGMDLIFIGNNWQIKNAKIGYICIYEGNRCEQICGICKKSNDLKICKCKYVYYCSK